MFAIKQKNNMQALLYANKYSEGELAEKNQEVNSQINAVVDEMLGFRLQHLTEEERQKLSSGELSREEALAIINGKKENGVDASETSDSEKNESVSNGAENNASITNDIIAEFYSLKSEYVGRINGLLAQGKSEWRAVPKENRTLTTQLTLAEKYMARGRQLESECDRRMSTLLKRLETELKASGQSTAIVSKITALYNDEKAVMKASLLGKYYPK